MEIGERQMNITTFDFNGSAVRTEIINGKPMFIANDVAAVLGFKNPRDAISRHCKGVVKSDTLKSGGHPTSAVPESDVYRLVMRSTLPTAEDFQDWVCETVLPSIRTNGGYISNQENETPEIIMARALQVANNVIQQHMAELALAKPKIEFHDTVVQSNQTYKFQEAGKKLQQRPNKFIAWMREEGYINKNNMPYQRYIEQGLFKTHSGVNDYGHAYTQGRITTKGLSYFASKLNNINL